MATEVESKGLNGAMASKITITPFWTTPSQIFYPKRTLEMPEKNTWTITGGVETSRTWYNAAEKALAAVNPFAKTTAVQNAIADQINIAGQRTEEVLAAARDTATGAARGIKSGFQWAVFLILLAVTFYVFLMVRPFIPTPARAS